MSQAVQAFLIVELVRVFCITAGCVLAYLGYRLFRLGVYEKQGELKAEYKDVSLTLRQIGPGVFFALFGVVMSYTGFARKFEVGPGVPAQNPEIHVVESEPEAAGSAKPAPAPDKPHVQTQSAPSQHSSRPSSEPQVSAVLPNPVSLSTETSEIGFPVQRQVLYQTEPVNPFQEHSDSLAPHGELPKLHMIQVQPSDLLHISNISAPKFDLGASKQIVDEGPRIVNLKPIIDF